MSSGAFTERRSSSNPVICPKCGTHHMRRLPREGFMQKKVWPLFGLFPWECPICRKLHLMRSRGKRVRGRRHTSESLQEH